MMAVGSELIRIEVDGRGRGGRVRGDAGRAGDRRRAAATPAASTAPRVNADLDAAPSRRRAPRRRPHRRAHARRAASTPGGERPLASPAGAPPRLRARHRPARRHRQRPRRPHRPRRPRRRAPPRRARAPAASRARQRRQPPTTTQAIPVIGLRRKIAQKMQESKRRIPHFTYVEEVDVTELEALRAQLNAQVGARARPSSRCCRSCMRAIVRARARVSAGQRALRRRGRRRSRGTARCTSASPRRPTAA